MEKLTTTEIKDALQTVTKWKKKGSEIQREFKFADFAKAMKFVNAVARAAEKADHHPDIDIRWNRVLLVLSTHSAGGLTELDFKMARTISRLAPQN
jgi:4a-hydroxytetrahydrobiopterin dehydratase